jgi:hypothetical protein
MSKAKVLAVVAAAALIGALGGCASAGGGSTSPYAGRHEHQRDAKQGAPASSAPQTTPVRRGSLRPVS